MTIIDKYISNNPCRPAAIVAEELGVSETFVKCRREIINQVTQPESKSNVTEEIYALVNLIDVRKIGWAVDIAKQRILQLEAAAHQK
jgi:PP-loop superfamily ATP-utilizing enzyme